MKKFILAAACTVLFMAGCEHQADGEISGNSPPVLYNPGAYAGSAQGYGGILHLNAEFSENALVEITIGEQQESTGRDAVRKALKNLPLAIVERQSAEVDVVSGATRTSNAIISAAQACIAQAGLGGE